MIFQERESKQIEFKSSVPKFDSLLKTCIAFANAAGGKIIIGIDDITHEVIGITDRDRIKIYDDFPNSLFDASSPNLIAQIYEQNYGEHSVLIIEIPASPRKPYFLKRLGIYEGTYIRVGSSTRKANREYIEDLMRESQRINYDEALIHAGIDILSKDYLHNLIGGQITTKRLLAEHIIGAKSANKELYAPTVAGTLMFAELPDIYITEALIRCTKFKGIEGRDILQTEDIVGPIERQALESLKIISHWITTHYALQGVRLKQQLPIPIEALREAIINALLHRKYNIPGSIKIAVYDNRVEIFSPGCFPGPVDINTLGDGMTYLRNPILARLAYKMNLIETRGTGVKLIYESCKKAGLRKPEYFEDGDFVKVAIYMEPDPLASDNSEDAILNYMRFRGNVTAKQIAEYLLCSHNTALRKLVNLIEAGKIVKHGKGSNVKYVLVT